jgi:membrane-associated protein
MSLHEVFMSLLEPQKIIAAFGLVGVIGIVFAETGLLIGFFLPGDSLLFTAGFLASQGLIPLAPLLIGTFLAAIIGDTVGYWFGVRTGEKLFTREDSRFFKRKYAEKARVFYETHGKKTIILARFIPIVRTFAPVIAGIGRMHYRTFIVYNVVGALLWAVGITLVGYFLGKIIPSADKYLLPIIILIVLTSFIPAVVHMIRERKGEEKTPNI